MTGAPGPAIVVDASTTIGWTLADERDRYALAVAAYVVENGALVPALWRWEVQNILLTACRRERITEAQMTEAVMLLAHLPIDIDPTMTFGAELALARQYGLTAYDAAYLELAMRSNCKIASNDKALRKAARGAGLFYEVE